jgi:hypothetical protein
VRAACGVCGGGKEYVADQRVMTNIAGDTETNGCSKRSIRRGRGENRLNSENWPLPSWVATASHPILKS